MANINAAGIGEGVDDPQVLLSYSQGIKQPGDRKPSKDVFGVLVGGEFQNKKAPICVMDASTDRRTPPLQKPEFSGPGHGLGPIPDL
jgi:hypothetical protein